MGICAGKKRANVLPLDLSDDAGPRQEAEGSKGPEQTAVHLHVELAVSPHAQELQDFYEPLPAELGRGKFGAVALAQSRFSPAHRYALKTVQAEHSPQSFERELVVWQELDHPCLVRLADRFVSESRIDFVMELCAGGDLVSRLVASGGLPERQVQRATHQLLLAVKYMHSKALVHRDIKPDNLLLLEAGPLAAVKLSDFGLSKRLLASTNNSIVGTAYYAAPEVFGRNYSASVDSWSIGATVYTLLAAEPPFFAQTNSEILHLAVHADLAFEKKPWQSVSSEARDFISNMMRKTPSDRMDAAAALQHPWLAEIDLEATVLAKRAQPQGWEASLHNALRFSPAKLGLCFLATRLGLLEAQEAAALARWFFLFDEERVGEVSLARFAAVAATLGSPLTAEDAALLGRVVSLQPQSPGRLSFSMFTSLLSSHRFLHSEQLRKLLFNRVSSQSTRVTLEQFTSRLAELTGLALPAAGGGASSQLLSTNFVDLI